MIGGLLTACPDLRVIATSREPLGLEGERLWNVPPLSLPTAHRTAGWRRSDALRLFEERARSVAPGFAIDDRNAEVVLEICRALGGLPLAIELAARRLRNLTLADLRSDLDELLTLLAPPRGRDKARHDTMRAAIDRSHALLEERERRVFRRLGVFEGGFTAPAAVLVCADDDVLTTEVLPTVSALAERSLVQLAGDDRYALLEVLRQYAREQLDNSGERDAVERRRAVYVAQMFDEAGTVHPRIFRAIIADHDNIRGAMRWSLAHDPALARSVLAKIWLVYVFPRPGMDPAEVEGWLERGLEDQDAPDHVRTRILVGLAQRRFARGERTGAVAAAREALRIATAGADEHMIASSHHRLALSAQAAGDLAESLGHFSDALAHYTYVSLMPLREVEEAWVLAARAQVHSEAGDAAEARADLNAALAISDRLPQLWRLRAMVRTREAEHLIGLDPKAAREAFNEALRVFQQEGSEVPVVRALRGLAEIAATSDPERALRLAGAAEDLRARVGDTWPEGIDKGGLARAAQRTGSRAAGLRAEGRRMSADEAVAYALDQTAAEGGPLALSAREREVASLVAEGLTSREIAYRLGITERTAENHVEHILVKLGLRSRSQIARWVMEHGIRQLTR